MKNRWVVAMALIGAVGCTHHNREEHEEADEHEVKMSINNIPDAARQTLMRESEGATINTVDYQNWHGKKVYEADATINGKNWEILVDANGKLVKKGLDTEENE
ncbi:MAG TPA: hypothetical protein VGG19_12970 [Tepidisphaeraceae bacterium]|jgi:hypothetical protein